jgi:hypothetical protein
MLWRIGMCLSRAKSLASIHFSGNQGITPTLKEHLEERIRCVSRVSFAKIGLELNLEPDAVQRK